MGLILDSSVIIAAERRGQTVERLIERIVGATGDQEAALSAVGLTELVHGLYRAPTPERRLRREAFLKELLADLTVYPYTRENCAAGGQIGRRTAEPRRDQRLKSRRGNAVAKVAIARKLAVRMFWMLRSGADYARLVRMQASPRATLVDASPSLG